MIRIPCGRRPVHEGWKYCVEGQLCPSCNAILILKAACLGVADGMEQLGTGTKEEINLYTRGSLEAWIGRLRADVARVDGRTE